MTWGRAVIWVVLAGCGDNRRAPAPADAPDPPIPDASICADLVCDDGDACTTDSCHPVDGCRFVAVARCAEPGCRLAECAGTDTDGDGLSDAWESQGYVDIDCNGDLDPAVDLVLPDADPLVANIYVEVDFLTKPGAGTACSQSSDCAVRGETCVANVCTHSHAPDAAALQAVVNAFAAKGLKLYIDPVHDAINENLVVTFGSLDPVCAGSDARSFASVKASHMDSRRRDVYRYGLFVHYVTCPNGTSCQLCPNDPLTNAPPPFGISGIAELPGNDFMVSLGRPYFDLGFTRPELDGTLFMHELGHNLDLRHGGFDSVNFKPNYVSVMNAPYATRGIAFTATPGTVSPIIGRRLDYSDVQLPDLDENALDEGAGIGATSADVIPFVDGQGYDQNAAANGPFDWNGNGLIDTGSVAADISVDTALTVLTGWRDWPTQACTTDADCPIKPGSGGTARIACVQQRCATMTFAFQCLPGLALAPPRIVTCE